MTNQELEDKLAEIKLWLDTNFPTKYSTAKGNTADRPVAPTRPTIFTDLQAKKVSFWVKDEWINADGSSSSSDSDYNAHTEYTLASISPDETLHFEGGDIFMTERSESIVFETYRDSDENVYASAPENQFFLEGMVPLIDENGKAIYMESADTWTGNLLDDYFGVRPWSEWIDLWESEGADRNDGLIMQRDYVAGEPCKKVFGAPDKHLSITDRSSFVFIKDDTQSFTVTNESLVPWSALSRTYILLEEGYIYTIRTPSRGFTFRRILNPIGNVTGWVVINLSTGGQHAFTTNASG